MLGRIDDVVWSILGGYTPKEKSVDNDRGYDKYNVVSILPEDKDIVKQILEVVESVQRQN